MVLYSNNMCIYLILLIFVALFNEKIWNFTVDNVAAIPEDECLVFTSEQ